MKILITGCAGFIGFHLTLFLLKNTKFKISGLDNLNNYYDQKLKYDRLKILKKNHNFKFFKIDINSKIKIKNNFSKYRYNIVIHLAAQAGVRHSIKHPENYLSSNVIGFFNILENSRKIKVKKLIYASTSSVYGNTNKFPLKEAFDTDRPLSFYAASKKSNEIFAYAYSNIYQLPTIGLRFFTVYGPYGRPDMALFKFTNNISKSKKIDLFNYGNHTRDFTYISDVVSAINKIISFNIGQKKIPFEIFNIASGNPKNLKTFIKQIEKNLNKKAKYNYMQLQTGDVKKTHGDIKKIKSSVNFVPRISIDIGIAKYTIWYKEYFLKK